MRQKVCNLLQVCVDPIDLRNHLNWLCCAQTRTAVPCVTRPCTEQPCGIHNICICRADTLEPFTLTWLAVTAWLALCVHHSLPAITLGSGAPAKFLHHTTVCAPQAQPVPWQDVQFAAEVLQEV